MGRTTETHNFPLYLGQFCRDILAVGLLWRLAKVFIASGPQFNFSSALCSFLYFLTVLHLKTLEHKSLTDHKFPPHVRFLGTWPKTVGGRGGPRNQTLKRNLDLAYQPPDWHWETGIRLALVVGDSIPIVPGLWYGATKATLVENSGRQWIGGFTILGDCGVQGM